MNPFTKTKSLTTTNDAATTTDGGTTPISVVAVVGLGRLGLRIAFELALCAHRNALSGGNAFRVMAYDANDKLPSDYRDEIRRELLTSLSPPPSSPPPSSTTTTTGTNARGDDVDSSSEREPRAWRRVMRDNEEAAIESHLFFTPDLGSAVRRADLVIEAVFEELGVKRELFHRIEAACEKKNVILSSNTLNLRLGDIGAGGNLSRPLVGLRFLFPVVYIPLVELTLNEANKEVLRVVSDFATNDLKKIAMGFDLDALLAGEAEAANLLHSRASSVRHLAPLISTSETLRERQERMYACGYLRYRMDEDVAGRYRRREARSRWGANPSEGEGDASSNSTTKMCAVCLNDETTGQQLVVLPDCGHACFCSVCIASVLRVSSRSVCPLCRTPFTANDVHVVL